MNDTEPEKTADILPITIEDEMRQSYLDYAMSVIVGRALPDVRDGLKPVHRRVLYAMNELRNHWDKPYKKSARIVGDVIGKYHPHGDNAVYDTMVRMAQPFSMRGLLIDGQGNFGSVDGDAPAAMRYTEVRLSKLAHELLADLNRETVDFIPNYDGNEQEPTVLPTRVPNLLLNGTSGIAVGMATNIPPHNLGEVTRACMALIDDPDLDLEGLMAHMPGPDFPTAALISVHGIRDAYETGRGRVVMRARVETETGPRDRCQLVVTELPYQVNKARLIEQIAVLVRDKKLEGIRTLRDESDKDGMRIVIELQQGADSEVVCNNLYQKTRMRQSFGVNMVALVEGQPEVLGLREILEAFLRHRREVVTRRTLFDLREARLRAHRLEGFAVALTNIDEVIALIKAAPDIAAARSALLGQAWNPGSVADLLAKQGADASRPENLDASFGLHKDGYYLSEVQAQAILELRLHRLTGMEQQKIHNDYHEVLELIAKLLEILANPEVLMQVIRGELADIEEDYADTRRTEIEFTDYDCDDEDLIPHEDRVLTLSGRGYAKSQSPDTYRAQLRGGVGKSAASIKDADYIEQMFVADTHDTVLCFTNFGRVHWLKVYKFPRGSRTAHGRPIVNLLSLMPDEKISAIMPVRDFSAEQYVVMATRGGLVKKVALSAFARAWRRGIIAATLREDDLLIGIALSDGQSDILLVTDDGKAVRFSESAIRSTGRTAIGVRGAKLSEGAQVISLAVIAPDTQDQQLLLATRHGYGKRTSLSDFPRKNRATRGVIAIRASERNGPVVGAVLAAPSQDVMLITDGGTLVRTRIDEISVIGRNTQGVRLIECRDGEQLTRVVCVEPLPEGATEDEPVVH